MGGILGGKKHFLLIIQAKKRFPQYEAHSFSCVMTLWRPQAESPAIVHFYLIHLYCKLVRAMDLQPLLWPKTPRHKREWSFILFSWSELSSFLISVAHPGCCLFEFRFVWMGFSKRNLGNQETVSVSAFFWWTPILALQLPCLHVLGIQNQDAIMAQSQNWTFLSSSVSKRKGISDVR